MNKRKPNPTPGTIPDRANRPAVKIPAIWQVVVECAGERQQQTLFERLKEEGYACRVLTL